MTEEEDDHIQLILNGYTEYKDDPRATDLTDWERGFMDDQIKRYEQYGNRTRFSDKQLEVMDRVYGKLPI